MTTRADVVREALEWEGTPYHHRARLKGVGADCAGMPAAVYEAVGLLPRIEVDAYPSDWMLHRSKEVFLDTITAHAREIGRDAIGPGDFAIWRFGRTYSHGAIVIDPPTVLHATIAAGAVIRGDMDRDEELRSRPVKFFTLF